jgi:hypothetical protein
VTQHLHYALAIAFLGLALVLDELASSVVVFRIGGGANLLCGEWLGMFRRDEGRCSSYPRRKRSVRLARLVGFSDLFEGIGGHSATT